MYGGGYPVKSPVKKRSGKTYGKQKSNLTFFGQWIEEINGYCGINQAELDARLGLSKGMVSRYTRGERQMNREMVRRLIHIYEEIIEEKQISLPAFWQHSLFLAWSEDETLVKDLPVRLDEISERRREAM